MERHLWTKNPQTHFWFWWRHTSIKFFYCMFIWNHMSSPNYTPLGLITWRHHSEISRDEYKCTRNPGNMVECHLWTKKPHVNGNVVERHLWTKNPHKFFFWKIRKIGSWKCHGASYMGNKTTLISWNISLSACNVIFGRDCLCSKIWFT